MNFDKILSVIFSFIIIIFVGSLVWTIGYSMLDVQGDPSTWDNWNGYKAAGSFLISNHNGTFGSINETQLTLSDCTPDIEGFSDSTGFLEFGTNGINGCESLNTGANILVYSENQDETYKIQVDGAK